MLPTIHLSRAHLWAFVKWSLIIAIGVELLLHVKVQENFRKPFLATSVREFWRTRAKILGASSAWFRELGGRMMTGFKFNWGGSYWRFCKWSFMLAAICWMVIYILSEAAEKLPDFVYVNF